VTYVKMAATVVSILTLAFLLVTGLLVRQGKFPARQSAMFCAVVCGATALLSLLGFWRWAALPWAVTAVEYRVSAFLLDRRSSPKSKM